MERQEENLPLNGTVLFSVSNTWRMWQLKMAWYNFFNFFFYKNHIKRGREDDSRDILVKWNKQIRHVCNGQNNFNSKKPSLFKVIGRFLGRLLI